jgi:hypothetical protein
MWPLFSYQLPATSFQRTPQPLFDRAIKAYSPTKRRPDLEPKTDAGKPMVESGSWHWRLEADLEAGS